MQEEYEQICSDLLAWIQQTIKWLNNRNFPNGLKEMQEELAFFNRYRKEDKPSKYKEKGDLEALIFLIQTKRTAMRLPAYVPAEGLLLHDMSKLIFTCIILID